MTFQLSKSGSYDLIQGQLQLVIKEIGYTKVFRKIRLFSTEISILMVLLSCFLSTCYAIIGKKNIQRMSVMMVNLSSIF